MGLSLSLTRTKRGQAGMDMMFFTPWDTPATIAHSLNSALGYVQKGAYMNVREIITKSIGYVNRKYCNNILKKILNLANV